MTGARARRLGLGRGWRLGLGLELGWRLGLLATLLAAGPAASQTPDWSLAARQRLQQGADAALERTPAAAAAERRRLLDAGEGLLAAGDTLAARASFDRAAMMLHAPDTEAALVRSSMQAGDYRQALAFGAHAAGAHRRDWPAGMALYAWLLHVGGQGVVARRMLDEALALAPGDAALLAASAQLASPWPMAEGVLRSPPLQIAPYAVGAPVGDPVAGSARVVGTAVLLGAGQVALLPSALLDGAGGAGGATPQRLWLRNGLGQTVEAWPLARDDGLGLVLLKLSSALPVAEPLAWADRAPFGGSPASMVEYRAGEGGAAWPLLRQGFFARLTTAPGPRLLGIAAPAGARGGPVFDAAGRLAGIAVAGADGVDRLVSASALASRFGPQLAAAGDAEVAAADLGPAGVASSVACGVACGGACGGAPVQAAPAAAVKRRVEIDEVYERALRTALQVLLIR